MDRRPKLARDFVDAILADALEHGIPQGRVALSRKQFFTDRWVSLILERFTSDDIPIPDSYVSSRDPGAVAAFRAKYPQIEPAIEFTKQTALEFWPDAEFLLRIHSDPEGCHVCREGQHLTLEVYHNESIHSDEDTSENGWTDDDGDKDRWQGIRRREKAFTEKLHGNFEWEETPTPLTDLIKRGHDLLHVHPCVGTAQEVLDQEARYLVERAARARRGATK